MRLGPINLKPEEAKALLSAKEGFGYPPGSDPWMAMEAARAKLKAAIDAAEQEGTDG